MCKSYTVVPGCEVNGDVGVFMTFYNSNFTMVYGRYTLYIYILYYTLFLWFINQCSHHCRGTALWNMNLMSFQTEILIPTGSSFSGRQSTRYDGCKILQLVASGNVTQLWTITISNGTAHYFYGRFQQLCNSHYRRVAIGNLKTRCKSWDQQLSEKSWEYAQTIHV